MKIRSLLTPLQVLAIFAATSAAFGQATVSNPGFEAGAAGSPPPGWFVPPMVTQAGYTVLTSTSSPKEGSKCAVLSLSSQKGQGFGNMMQSIDARPFRGKRVRFRAAVRYQGGSQMGQAQLWFRVDRSGDQTGFFNNMADRPITSSSWAFYEITGDIAADAESINFGMMLVGGGSAYIDAVTVGTSDVQDEPVEKPRALTDRGLQNLVAFTKLFGYVRHFHPSDAVEKADWNAFAMAGVKVAEDAKDPADLAQRLEAFFRPIAPTVKVFVTGAAPAVAAPTKGAQIVTWENVGFGGGTIPENQNIYHSKRIFVSASTTGAPNPKTPFEADLGGGVSCQVPLALYAEGGSALPHTPDPVVPKGVRSEPTGNDRTTRLADIVLAWNVYENFYPYSDVVKTDWPAVLRSSLTSAATDADERAFLDTLRRLVAAAKDGHGRVSHRSDTAYAMPPFLADWVEDKFVVTVVSPDMKRLQPGDEIVSIDGKPLADVWKEQEALISGATEGWKRGRGKWDLLRGPEGSSMEIGVRRGTAAPFTMAVARAGTNQLREKRPKAIEELKLGYWYVDLDNSRAKMDEYKKALRDLTSADGVIFDMRGYPNEVAMDVLPRLAKVPITSANWNVPKFSKPDEQGVQFLSSHWPMMEPTVPKFRGKIVFITDGGAISYAESVMGIVENYKLGEIVGEPTAGTNGNINPFSLPGGYTVVFTGMKVTKHDGSTHHGVGIKPTIPAHRTIAGVAAGRDELLEKALAVIRGQ